MYDQDMVIDINKIKEKKCIREILKQRLN